MKARTLCWILIGAGWLHAQAVVSRRDYAEHGRTFTQIWMADAGTLNFRQLTHSARDHSQPVCSRDRKLIYFVSDRDVERSRNSYGDYHSGEREVWAYDRRTGQERFIWRTSRDLGLDLRGTTANGGVLLSVGTELRSLAQNPWVIDNVDEAAVSPDGRSLALVIAGSYDQDAQSQNAKLFVVDAITGAVKEPWYGGSRNATSLREVKKMPALATTTSMEPNLEIALPATSITVAGWPMFPSTRASFPLGTSAEPAKPKALATTL
jgi:hypothetical protein